MSKERIKRALEVTRWADRPLRWAIRLSLADAPFKALRKLPLKALARTVEFQLLLLNK